MPEADTDGLWRVLTRRPGDAFRVGLGRLHGELIAAKALSPILVLGPPGSGKTSGVVVPAVLEWPGPAVVISVTGETVERTVETRRRLGDVFVIDPHDFLPDWSFKTGWNPLDEIRDWEDAQRMAIRLLGAKTSGLNDGDFWQQAAIRLLAPHLFAAATARYTMADVMRWILTQEEYEVRALLAATGNENAMAAADAGWSREDRARSSIYTTVEVQMNAWADERVQRWARIDNKLRLSEFLNGRPNTLYVCVSGTAGKELASLTVALIQDLMSRVAIANRGFAGHLVGREGIIAALESSPASVMPLLLILDDAAETAPVANLKSFAGMAAKGAIQLVSVFSDLSEMQSVFTETTSRAVVNNHPVCVIMPGTRDTVTLDYVMSVSRGDAILGSDNAEVTHLTARQIPDGRALCLCYNVPPIELAVRFELTDDELAELPGAPHRRMVP